MLITFSDSPREIRTPVRGSKAPYPWPLDDRAKRWFLIIFGIQIDLNVFLGSIYSCNLEGIYGFSCTDFGYLDEFFVACVVLERFPSLLGKTMNLFIGSGNTTKSVNRFSVLGG